MKKSRIIIPILTAILSITAHAIPIEEVSDTVRLINYENFMEASESPTDLVRLYNYGIRVSTDIIQGRIEAVLALDTMEGDIRAEGITNYIVVSGFRDYDLQTTLFSNKVNSHIANGMSEDEAKIAASTAVAVPGTSEHQSGLAFDISANGSALNYEQAKTPIAQWLAANAHNYGFILRFTEDKTDVTKIMFEPWHYRYVGQPHAQLIFENDFVLEEYFEYIKTGNNLTYTNEYGIDFVVSYTTDVEAVPNDIGATASIADMGGYVITTPTHDSEKTIMRFE